MFLFFFIVKTRTNWIRPKIARILTVFEIEQCKNKRNISENFEYDQKEERIKNVDKELHKFEKKE